MIRAFAPHLLTIGLAAAALAGCQTTTTTNSQSSVINAASPTQEEDAGRRARVRLELAQAYFSRGQLEAALADVNVAIKANPRLGAAYNLRGLIYAGKAENALARESFNRALEINPRDADTMQNFGWHLCEQRQYAEADALFAQALAVPLYAEGSRTLLTRGICQARAGQWMEAEGSLTRSYELDPTNPTTALNLSEVLYRRNELERARFYVRRLNGNPDLANAQTLWLGVRIEHKLGNRQGEFEAAERLRNRFPTSREAAALEGGRFDD